jgi:hypothetical protein
VAPHFERAIPNTPGKSLVVVVVDYAPSDASLCLDTHTRDFH